MNKISLTCAVLASTLFVSYAAVAAREIVTGPGQSCSAGGCDTFGIDFATDNSFDIIPILPATSNTIGASPYGDNQSVSVINTTPGVSFSGTIDIKAAPPPVGTTADTVIKGDVGVLGTGIKLLDFNGGAATTLQLLGDVNALTLNAANDSTITVADGKNLNIANVTTAVTNQATLTFLGTSTSGGDIGAAGKLLKVVNANKGTYTSLHPIWATTTNVNNAGTIFSIERPATTPALLTYTTNLIVNTGGTLKVADNNVTALTGFNLMPSATLDVVANKAGTPQLINKGAFSLDASGGANAVVSNTSTVHLAATGDTFATGDVIQILDGKGGTAVQIPVVTGNSATYSYKLATTAGGSQANGADLFAIVTTTTFGQNTINNTQLTSLAKTLDTIGPTVTTSAPGLVPMFNPLRLVPAPNGNLTQLHNSLYTLLPSIRGEHREVISSGVNKNISYALRKISRPADLRAKPRDAGIHEHNDSYYPPYLPAGDRSYYDPEGAWSVVHVDYFNQSSSGGIGGYSARNIAFAFGGDIRICDPLTIGFGLGYITSDIDAEDVDDRSDIHTYQAFVYGRYERELPYYIEGALSVAYNQFDEINHIVIPTIGDIDGFVTANRGVFNGWFLSSLVEMGYEMQMGNVLVVPHMVFMGGYLFTSDFTETSTTGGVVRHIQYSDVGDLKAKGAIRLSTEHYNKSMHITSYMHVGFVFDFLADSQSSTASFLSGTMPIAPSYYTPGLKPASLAFVGGLGFLLSQYNSNYFTFEYNVEYRHNFFGHGGLLKYRYEWK